MLLVISQFHWVHIYQMQFTAVPDFWVEVTTSSTIELVDKPYP